MRQNTLALCLLAALISPAYSAPIIPKTYLECSHYASCRPFQQLIKSSPKPDVQSEAEAETISTAAAKLSAFPLSSVTPAEDLSIPVLDVSPPQPHTFLAGFAASEDESPEVELSKGGNPGITRFHRACEKVKSVTKSVASRCHRVAKTTTSMSVSSYGFTYVRRDYTDFLVVSVVLLFLLAVVLVEIMDKVMHAMGFFRTEEGAIRLEEEPLPRYSPRPEIASAAPAYAEKI